VRLFTHTQQRYNNPKYRTLCLSLYQSPIHPHTAAPAVSPCWWCVSWRPGCQEGSLSEDCPGVASVWPPQAQTCPTSPPAETHTEGLIPFPLDGKRSVHLIKQKMHNNIHTLAACTYPEATVCLRTCLRVCMHAHQHRGHKVYELQHFRELGWIANQWKGSRTCETEWQGHEHSTVDRMQTASMAGYM